jgi:hypothetical protein
MPHFLLVEVALCKHTATLPRHSVSTLPANRLTQLGVRVSSSEDEFIKSIASQADGVLSKSDVIRLLIQDAMRKGWTPLANLVPVPNVALCPAGAGDTEVIEMAADECLKITQTAVEKTSLPPTTVREDVGRGVQRGTPKKGVPDLLKPFEDAIRAYWRVKQGSKSDTAWNRLMNNLLKFLDKYGKEVVEEQLGKAESGKWKGIELSNYESMQPAKKAPEPEPKHPAYRDFTAERLKQEAADAIQQANDSLPNASPHRLSESEINANNILKELF